MSEQQAEERGVGASLPLLAIAAGALAVLVLAVGVYLYRSFSADVDYGRLVIATGPVTGTYHALGISLARVLASKESFSTVEVLSTDGSAQNMGLISEPGSDVDLAFVQGDASPSTNARLITTLYDEVLHIVLSPSASERIRSIYDLQGQRVTLGAAGSGTRELSGRVLRHFGVEVGEDLLLSPAEMVAALAQDQVDAAFLLSPIPSRLITDLAQQDGVRFLSLGESGREGGEAHALELNFPGMRRKIIPRSTYVRLPRRPVHTVGVTAMLVAREDVDEELVRDITSILFGHRAGELGLEGSELAVARQIREDYDPATVTIPYHPGSHAYYLREQPPFFVEYAEALSLGLTLLLALYSVFIAVREWLRRRMKNRVDAYLLQAEGIVEGMRNLGPVELKARYDALEAVRRAAFDDLIAERLYADEAFVILQNYLRDELASIESRLSRELASG